jgi:hypothetical protein
MKPCTTVLIVTLLFVAGCISGCGVVTPGLPADAYQAEADAVVVMAFAASHDEATAPDDSSPDRKVGDKCDNCHGTGKSGDGHERCKVCNGDGRIDREDIRAPGISPALLEAVLNPPTAPTASTTPTVETTPMTIELHVSQQSAGGWARDWWNTDRPYFESLGYTVTFVKADSPETWIQVTGKSPTRVDGQPTREKLLAILEKLR